MAPDLKPTQDEVLRRVGRNLVIFQQIEQMVKFLLASHKGGGTTDNHLARHQENAECINKKMLGLLVERYGNEVLQDAGEEVPDEDRPEGWFSFLFQISGDTEFVESLRRDLKLMTYERNELVHGFIPRWKPESKVELEDTLTYLDVQREKVLPMHEHLMSTMNGMQQSRTLLLNFMNSPEYEKQSELMWLQASPLVALLSDVATQIQRKDGWTYLAQAGDLAAKNLPEEVKALKERYGFKTLKKLLAGSEMLDIFDEPLSSGRFRTLYRKKEMH